MEGESPTTMSAKTQDDKENITEAASLLYG